MQSLVNDFRYGARILARNPGFAIAAVICPALGIGATTATKADPMVALRYE